jgi:hypothetical protein
LFSFVKCETITTNYVKVIFKTKIRNRLLTEASFTKLTLEGEGNVFLVSSNAKQ